MSRRPNVGRAGTRTGRNSNAFCYFSHKIYRGLLILFIWQSRIKSIGADNLRWKGVTMQKNALVKEKIYKTFVLEDNAIPTEATLCRLYNTSRTTVRRALESLAAEGKVQKIKGKGFINIGMSQVISNMNTEGLYNDNLRLGNITKSQVISKNILAADELLASKLDVAVGTALFHMIRLRFVNDRKFSITENYIPLYLAPEIEAVDFNEVSLWEYLKSINIFATLKKQTVFIRHALETEQFYLNISDHDPVMVVQNTGYDNKVPVDYSIITANAYYIKLNYTMQ